MLIQKECGCGTRFSTARKGVFLCRRCRFEERKQRARERRKQRELEAPGSHTPQEFGGIISRQNCLCYWCHRTLKDPSGKVFATRDHLLPLSRGGSNSSDNIVAACWPCNREKGTMTAGEYRVFLAQHNRPFSEFPTLPASAGEGGVSVSQVRSEAKKQHILRTLNAELSPEDPDGPLHPDMERMLANLKRTRTMDPTTTAETQRAMAKMRANTIYLREGHGECMTFRGMQVTEPLKRKA